MTIPQVKDEIDLKITGCGTGCITGSVLNGVLNDICDAVSDEFNAVDLALQAIIGE